MTKIFKAMPGESEAQARERLRVQRINEGRTDEVLTSDERAYLRHLENQTQKHNAL